MQLGMDITHPQVKNEASIAIVHDKLNRAIVPHCMFW
jgi:hypothetical protein